MLKYSQRAELTAHPLAKKLFQLMERKQTNLAVAADLNTTESLIHFADIIGPSICVFKTHIDILSDFTSSTIKRLQEIANKHQFLIFEDRKFADIGNTALQQYQGGVYRISEWAHLTNAHSIFGPGLIEGLRQEGLSRGNGLLLLAQLSAKGHLIDDNYIKQTIELALRYPDFVMGFIAQEKLSDDPRHIHMTPGVQLATGTDSLGQQYNTPEHVIGVKHSDIIIVGRGILHASDQKLAAEEYRAAGWKAYNEGKRQKAKGKNATA